MKRNPRQPLVSNTAAAARGDRRVSSRRLITRLLRILAAAAVAYLIVLVLAMFFENALIFPVPNKNDGDWDPSDFGAERVTFQAEDGVQLDGWLLEHPQPRAHVLICHANAEHLGYLGDWLADLRDTFHVTVFAFDYRGYGRSEGRPNEQGVLADGRAAQAWLAVREGIDAQDIVLMGRSLGGAVAVDLAARNGARGLILESTFTRLPDLAARLFPWAPVRWLMRSRFDSLGKIARYDGPLLQSHSTADELIPYEMGRELFDAAPGKNKRFVAIRGGGHNDPQPPDYRAALDEFLAELPPHGRRPDDSPTPEGGG